MHPLFHRNVFIVLATILLICLSGCQKKPAAESPTPPPAAADKDAVSDSDIADAYLYLLGRVLVLRQQRLDFEQEGFQWNQILYREPGGVDFQ